MMTDRKRSQSAASSTDGKEGLTHCSRPHTHFTAATSSGPQPTGPCLWGPLSVGTRSSTLCSTQLAPPQTSSGSDGPPLVQTDPLWFRRTSSCSDRPLWFGHCGGPCRDVPLTSSDLCPLATESGQVKCTRVISYYPSTSI